MDAEDESAAGWPRFVNHSRRRVNCTHVGLGLGWLGLTLTLTLTLTQTRRVNCKHVCLRLPVVLLGRVPLGLWVRTTREIAPGEELLLDYGSAYWDRCGLAYPNPRRLAIDFL